MPSNDEKRVKVSSSSSKHSNELPTGAVKVKKHKEVEDDDEIPSEVEEPEEEEDEEEEFSEEEEEDSDENVSLDTNDILQNDPLYFVLSRIFLTTDEGKNVADILQDIVKRLDTLIDVTKKANKKS